MSFTLEKLPPGKEGSFGGSWCQLHMWQPGHVPSPAAPTSLSSYPSSELFLLQSGLGGYCFSTPKTQMCKPSARNSAKSYFVWPQPLPVSERTGMIKPLQGRGPLLSPWAASLHVAVLWLKKARGEMEVQKLLLLWAVAQADRALTQGNGTLLVLVCSTTIPWLYTSVCR